MKSIKMRCCFFKYVAEAASQVFCIKVRHCLFKYAVPGAASQVCCIKVRGRPSNLVSLLPKCFKPAAWYGRVAEVLIKFASLGKRSEVCYHGKTFVCMDLLNIDS